MYIYVKKKMYMYISNHKIQKMYELYPVFDLC